MQTIGAAMAPWLDLLIRFWLAQVFLTGAAVSLVMREPLAMAGTGVGTQLVNAVINSPLGIAVETVCPALLLIGLFSRPAAVPLLIQALLLQGPNGPSDIHLFWAVLLGWSIVFGPGPLSLDRLLGRGLDSSAVPGVKWIGAAYASITKALGPF